MCDWVENKDEMTGWNFVKQTFIKAWEVTVTYGVHINHHPLNRLKISPKLNGLQLRDKSNLLARQWP